MDPALLDEAHRFWFGELSGPDDFPDEETTGRWFRQSDDMDAEIRGKFGGHLEAVVDAAWDLGALSRTQQVGLVIFLDQFPRNLFRVTGQAFAYDGKARAIADALIAGGLDRFFACERAFVLMPLMHSEDIRDQDRCAFLFAGEALTVTGDNVERFRTYLDFAFMHRKLIRQFGRFPHRNEMLGRESTEDELKHLEGGRGY